MADVHGSFEGIDDPVLLGELRELSRRLASGTSVASPAAMVAWSARALPHGGHAALTLLRRGRRPRTLAASDALARQVDALQYEVGAGPGLTAAAEGSVVLAEDLGRDERWGGFGAECVHRTGIRSVLSLRVLLGGTDRAALSHYAAPPHAFGGGDVATMTALLPFVAHAVEAHLRSGDVDNLSAALHSNRLIGMAVGMLMAQHHLSADQAFTVLSGYSQAQHVKLHDLASEVARTGALPGRAVPPSGG